MDFNKETHEYTENGSEYVSVTKFIKRFEPEFPKELLANKIAKRDGTSTEVVISKWETNAQVSRDYGKAIHGGIEYWIDHAEFSKLNHIKEAVEKFSEKFDRTSLKSEQVISNDSLKLAGTIDVLQKLGNKKVNLIDLKTNYEIEEKGKGYFLAPIQELPYNKLNVYRLQLSLYKYLLTSKGLIVEDMWIEHWTGKEWNKIKIKEIEQEILNKLWQTLS